MTASLTSVVRRRWYLFSLGLVLTGIFAVQAARAPGVYFAQVYVVFLPPNGASANALAGVDTDNNLIHMAGIVGRVISQGPGAQPVSDGVTILGEGLTSGYSVRQPNDGGQWVVNFDKPELDVQVAGRSPRQVSETLSQVLARIDSELQGLQVAAGTAPDNMIQTRLSPPIPYVYVVRGSRVRAGLFSLLLGLGLTISALRWADGVLARSKRDRGDVPGHKRRHLSPTH